MSAGCFDDQNTCDDQVFLVSSFAMACHCNCSSVSVEVFLTFQLASRICMLELIRVSVEQIVDCQSRTVGFLAGCFQQILFIQQCCSESGAVVAFHLNPSGDGNGRVSQKAFCNWCDQHVLGSCAVHLHWAGVHFGGKEWLMQEVQQVGHCCFGSCVDNGSRFICIVERIQSDKRFWVNVLVRFVGCECVEESSGPAGSEGWSLAGGMVDTPNVGSDKLGPVTAEMSREATKG